jgi:hypothetical protein
MYQCRPINNPQQAGEILLVTLGGQLHRDPGNPLKGCPDPLDNGNAGFLGKAVLKGPCLSRGSEVSGFI